MDLNMMLWVGGTLFSLGIFAVKTGLGLGYAGIGAALTALVMAGYTLLFVLIASASGWLMQYAAPLLQKGPYMHSIMAGGLILWGVLVILKRPSGDATDGPRGRRGGALLMALPCPICLSAMVFSVWSALNVLKQPPLAVGLTMGVAFSLMAALVTLLIRLRKGAFSQHSLGMAMIAVGLYFVFSLFLPARIEAAKGVYSSFVHENSVQSNPDSVAVAIFLLVALLAGFFARKKEKGCQ